MFDRSESYVYPNLTTHCPFTLQGFQSQITALQEEMEEKGQEMEKLQLDLKDKEVENKIAGKKGDQLVSCLSLSCLVLFGPRVPFVSTSVRCDIFPKTLGRH